MPGNQFAAAIVDLLPKERGILRCIHFFAVPGEAAGAPLNVLQIPATATGQFLPSPEFGLVLSAGGEAAKSVGSLRVRIRPQDFDVAAMLAQQ